MWTIAATSHSQTTPTMCLTSSFQPTLLADAACIVSPHAISLLLLSPICFDRMMAIYSRCNGLVCVVRVAVLMHCVCSTSLLWLQQRLARQLNGGSLGNASLSPCGSHGCYGTTHPKSIQLLAAAVNAALLRERRSPHPAFKARNPDLVHQRSTPLRASNGLASPKCSLLTHPIEITSQLYEFALRVSAACFVSTEAGIDFVPCE